MAREICKLTMTIVEEDEATTATGSVSFDGNGHDVVNVLEHIFDVLKLEPNEALIFSLEAIKQMRSREGEKNE